MLRLLLESYSCLLRVAFTMRGRSGLRALHDVIRAQAVETVNTTRPSDAGSLCRAMDLACVFYLHRVLCLQRSAATTLFLRHHGIPAQMVIGVKQIPFRSHAWVELNGEIVNDRPYLREIYQELERC